MRVTILHNPVLAEAPLDDQETLIQVAAVHEALLTLGHKVSRASFTVDVVELTNTLEKLAPDVVFNLVESVHGKSKNIYLAPLLLSHLKIPFTGANANNLFITTNKVLAKQWLCAGKFLTPNWIATAQLKQQTSLADGPYILKSVSEDGSIGLADDSIIFNVFDLQEVLKDRLHRFGGEWFAEKFIEGREFNISLLPGLNPVLPIAEIQFLPQARPLAIVDYAAKWENNSKIADTALRNFDFPAADDALLSVLTNLSKACNDWFQLTSYARIDMRIDAVGKPWILELNANPSLSPDAGFVAAAAKAGFTYPELMQLLLEMAFQNH